MSDGIATESGVGAKEPVKTETSKSPWGFLRRLGGKFRRNGGIAHETPLQDNQSQLGFGETESRSGGIAEFIRKEIEEKGLKPPPFEIMGASNFSFTNERVNHQTLEDARDNYHLEGGYLVGVGVSNIFTLLDAYPPGKGPSGIVMINIDPRAVEEARIFVEGLKEGLVTNFIGEYAKQTGGYKYEPTLEYSNMDWDSYKQKALLNGVDVVFPETSINRHFSTLQELARAGNIAVVQQDFFNPALLNVISTLPRFRTSNNLIYLSNIADWIFRSYYRPNREAYDRAKKEGRQSPFDYESMFSTYNNLAVLSPKQPRRNFFADVLAVNGYRLRIQPGIPTYREADLKPG